MNVNQIIKEIEITESNIATFIKDCETDFLVDSSYDNWNAKDILSHINEWIKYSKNKLHSIRNKKSYLELSDYHEFNNEVYIKKKIKI